MSTNEDRPITPGMMIRMTRATAIAEAQFLEAERIANDTLRMSVAHPDRALVVATLMQVLATNLNAVVANASS